MYKTKEKPTKLIKYLTQSNKAIDRELLLLFFPLQ